MTIQALSQALPAPPGTTKSQDPAGTGRVPAILGAGAGRASATGGDTPAPGAPAPLQDLERAREVAAEANRRLARTGAQVEFSIDDATRRVVARIVDRHTREVIRQVPSETVLAIAEALDKVLPGVAVDEQA